MASRSKSGSTTKEITVAGACDLLETALKGPLRDELLAAVADSKDFGQALTRLRPPMRSHVWNVGSRQLRLQPVVAKYDSHARRQGFHVLHDWDGTLDQVNEDPIAVDVLNYLIEQRGPEPIDRTSLAILVDYYFLYILALLSLKVWEDGDADENLDRLDTLVRYLQGPDGSGHRFVDNAETLILIATSHYEPHEQGYDALLQRVQTLNRSHQKRVALSHAQAMGGHLRFGFEATYGRDLGYMRADNVVDYPWLCYALATLMREYSQPHDDDDRVVEGLLNGLTPDATAFAGDHPPASLAPCADLRSDFRDRFHHHRQELLDKFEAHRPSSRTYSPISFFFNFSYNVLKGMVVDALIWGEARTLTLNDMMTAFPRDEALATSKTTVASTLMGYARVHPERIRGRLMPVIVYDPQTGRQAFSLTMKRIRG
ncbi:MAG: hypothetical protein HY654_10140 [Acidobacteria bacterium]|nr:hypothetical protein [Acidobacteriota bacterium]